MSKKIISLALALLLVAAIPVSAFAAYTPSVTRKEETELVSGEAFDAAGSKVEGVLVQSKAFGNPVSETDNLNAKFLDEMDEAVIKVTTLSQALAANLTVNGMDLPMARRNELATVTGIGYTANQEMIDLYNAMVQKQATSDILAGHGADVSKAPEEVDKYVPVVAFNVTANQKAMDLVGQGGTVKLVLKVAGIKAGAALMLEHICADGTVEFLKAVSEKDGEVTMTVHVAAQCIYVLYVKVA